MIDIGLAIIISVIITLIWATVLIILGVRWLDQEDYEYEKPYMQKVQRKTNKF